VGGVVERARAAVLGGVEAGPDLRAAPDTLALADHRVGLSLLTTPLIWAGASPFAAYGVAFLASFVASAGAAYALCVSVGASRPAAFVGGLVFGFHPFRAAHLEHVELLSAYWLPLSLVGLHRWNRNHSRLALAGVTVTLVLQALTSGYYYFFSGVLVAGWVGWFAVRGTSWRHLAELATSLIAPLVVLAPMLWWYARRMPRSDGREPSPRSKS
jgi:ABC-type Fe3+-siderophore transport system permease subunit